MTRVPRHIELAQQKQKQDDEVHAILAAAGRPLATTEVAEQWGCSTARDALAVLERLEKAMRVRTGKRGSHRGGQDQNAYLCSPRNYGWRYWATQEVAATWAEVMQGRQLRFDSARQQAATFCDMWKVSGAPLAARYTGAEMSPPSVNVRTTADMEKITIELSGLTVEQFEWLSQALARRHLPLALPGDRG